MYSVSVIMPVYNNEKTLRKSIESVLNQTIYGFELILVNDGSTDTSAQICDEYARKEPLLVEVIHQKRQGLAVARNKGLFKSSGEYVYFADPTDIFNPRMLQSNVKLAREREVDLVVFGFTSIDNEGTDGVVQHLPRMPILTDETEFRNHYRNFHLFNPHALFNKLYKRSYLFENRLKFHNLPIMEDAFFNLKAYKEISSVAFNRKAHCYRSESERLMNHHYMEHFYTIYMEYINSLETVFKYWGVADEYSDLIASEHYKALIAEINNINSINSPLSKDQQVKILNEILSRESVQINLHQIKLASNKKKYNRMLISYLQSGNGMGAIELLNRREEIKQATKGISKLLNGLFK